MPHLPIGRRAFLAGVGAATVAARLPATASEAIFDSHMHLATGDTKAYPPAPIDGIFHPHMIENPNSAEAFARLMAAGGVSGACAVQRAHLYGYDNRYILDAVQAMPGLYRAVIVVDTAAPGTPAQIIELARQRKIAAIRLMGDGSPDDSVAWLGAASTVAVWAAADRAHVAVDVEILAHELPRGLPMLMSLARRFPRLSVVIDHVGMTPAQGGPENQTRRFLPPGYGLDAGIREIAKLPNVSVKVTEMNIEILGHDKASAREFVRRVVVLFGDRRVMWGSDYPQTKGSYAEMVANAHMLADALPPGSRQRFLHDNAARIFA